MKLSHLWVTTLMELKKIYNDKRRLLVLVLGPIIICLIYGAVSYQSPKDINVTVFIDKFNHLSSLEYEKTRQIVDDIDRSETFLVYEVYSLKDAVQRLNGGVTRATIIMEEGTNNLETIRVTVDVTDRIVQQAIMSELPSILAVHSRQSTIESLPGGMSSQQSSQIVTPFSMALTTNENQTIKYFDFGASGVIVLFVLGISLLMAATAITSERSKGTIERIFASPYKDSEIIISKMLAYSLFAITVAVIIVLTLKLVFDIVLGNIFLMFFVTVLVGVNAVVLGLLVSAATYTELESILGAVSFWFLSLILMGFTWPLETMHHIFTYLSRLIPYSYGVHATRNINLAGWGLSQIWLDLVILSGFIVVQLLAVMLMLKREIR